jgi:hypothetical protein
MSKHYIKKTQEEKEKEYQEILKEIKTPQQLLKEFTERAAKE